MAALANAKHEAFARAIVEGKAGREAYAAAGYTAKAAAADTNASRLLKNAQVSARVAELKAAAAQGSVMAAREVLEELSKIGRADMADFVRAFALGDPVAAVDALSPDQTAALGEVTVEQFMDGAGDAAREVRRIKFKLTAKTPALELLGKHHKLYTEKHEHTGKDGKPIEVKDVTDAQRAKALAAFIAKTRHLTKK